MKENFDSMSANIQPLVSEIEKFKDYVEKIAKKTTIQLKALSSPKEEKINLIPKVNEKIQLLNKYVDETKSQSASVEMAQKIDDQSIFL